MGYAPPSFDDLPLPTKQEFEKDPEFYWNKLEQFHQKIYKENKIKMSILIVGTIALVIIGIVIVL